MSKDTLCLKEKREEERREEGELILQCRRRTSAVVVRDVGKTGPCSGNVSLNRLELNYAMRENKKATRF